MGMFNTSDIVKVLIPNVINTGYDYRLTAPADIGTFVRCSVLNHQYIGVVVGAGDSNLDNAKIKSVLQVYDTKLSTDDIKWIYKMADWTLMTPGAVLKLIVNVPDAFGEPQFEQLYKYNNNNNLKMTESRQSVADAFASNENDFMSVSDIQNISHVSSAVIKNMIKNGGLIPVDKREKKQINNYDYVYKDMQNIELNDEQSVAANTIAQHLNDFSVFLLDGITGSGKTQVYFDSALRAYLSGKSVLLMMPEISLTAQFISRFEQRFGAPPVVWHSNLSAARRREIWRGVASGNIKMVIGTRSALFLPWQNLGLIVVDEEHDTSYKQEDMGNYHARDMAILRAKIGGFPIVLASATPSLETVRNVELNKYTKLQLTSRFGGAQLPSIETINMRNNHPQSYILSNGKEQAGCISQQLFDEIKNTLDKQQQVMLFINRRGFVPIIQCKKCGWVAGCPDCSSSMTYHKHIGKLLCHLCGRKQDLPTICPNCGNEVTMRGVGLEKVQEEVNIKFPSARTAIVSSDTILSRQALERLVNKMENNEIDIIIGTQILAKGHHFPNLTLVGVIDADMGLFGTDFRAGEHTFQQLFQVAGRAGRGEFPGRVFLQTYQPENPVIASICSCNRDDFLHQDMENRKIAKMPPFGQLIAVIIEGQKETILKKYCDDLLKKSPVLNGGKIMGPIPAQIYQIRNWYRMRFLISGDAKANLQPIVSDWLSKVKQPVNIRIKIDVNPQNFM
ncbi:MAG: primosomal protein N' [Alphaproteobacteria bacterium]|nr:primosomal protein N' [Alphaproteobacteria bacterium]